MRKNDKEKFIEVRESDYKQLIEDYNNLYNENKKYENLIDQGYVSSFASRLIKIRAAIQRDLPIVINDFHNCPVFSNDRELLLSFIEDLESFSLELRNMYYGIEEK